MKKVLVGFVIVALFSACKENTHSNNETTTSTTADPTADKQEITSLVRKMLNWAWPEATGGGINLLPAQKDSKDSIYIGFDLAKHELNLKKLKETGFFATEFINNYDKIIRTLDRKLRNHELETWLVGDLPSFNFPMDDADPWCHCQDVPYDKPNPWDSVLVTVKDINSDRATLGWTWGHSDWSKNFEYKVRATKENGKWKIAWLQGFDFAESMK